MTLLLAAVLPSAANAATTVAGNRVVVVQPATLVKTADLSFGNIIPGAAPGTVRINEFTQARTFTGGVTLAGGTISAARFSGYAAAPSHLKIDVPNGSITISNGTGGTMTVGNFELNGDKNDWVSANEAFEIQVGATLNVGANQPTGTYTGTFTVTVNYR